MKGIKECPTKGSVYKVKSEEQTDHHYRVMSMMISFYYAARRTRPADLTFLSFMSTRCSKANEEDFEKMDRYLQFVNFSSEEGITLDYKGTYG